MTTRKCIRAFGIIHTYVVGTLLLLLDYFRHSIVGIIFVKGRFTRIMDLTYPKLKPIMQSRLIVAQFRIFDVISTFFGDVISSIIFVAVETCLCVIVCIT